MVSKYHKEVAAAVERFAPEYFAAWKQHLKRHPTWSKEASSKEEDRDFAKAFGEYIAKHNFNETQYRSSLEPDKLAGLEAEEAAVIERWKLQVLPVVNELGLHFA